jgi:hypothetical protein
VRGLGHEDQVIVAVRNDAPCPGPISAPPDL